MFLLLSLITLITSRESQYFLSHIMVFKDYSSAFIHLADLLFCVPFFIWKYEVFSLMFSCMKIYHLSYQSASNTKTFFIFECLELILFTV